MLIYHGSNGRLGEVSLAHRLPYQDFGPGFYAAAEEEQAWQMSLYAVAREGCGVPTLTTLEVPDDLLQRPDLRCKVFPEQPDMDWARFVWNNRNRDFSDSGDANCNQDCKYDVVFGPAPNDRFLFALSELSRTEDREGFLAFSLPRHALPQQYSFHTERALACLRVWDERDHAMLQRCAMQNITADLVRYRMEDAGLSIEQALDQVYLSGTFSKLEDPGTGLYRESAASVYERLKRELAEQEAK